MSIKRSNNNKYLQHPKVAMIQLTMSSLKNPLTNCMTTETTVAKARRIILDHWAITINILRPIVQLVQDWTPTLL